ncbi:nucleoporin nup85 [Acrodontium crateriforme]|uniref:Nuclear pore complex protein Nup85 n=1 Tax=Acrodontium crateriforme TaxID=150365 RepID=A0AAQ3R6K6_9PEZI|nr:nucleoporin nup85 [Acrodontium crateriforme]
MSLRFPSVNELPSTPTYKKNSVFSHPSTTPAGPPPTHLSNPSTTPAGPPPRSIFGSSTNHASSKLTFGHKLGRRGFQVPSSSPPPMEEDDEDYEEDAPGEDDYTLAETNMLSPSKGAFMESIRSSPRGLKRSRNGKVREHKASDMPALARGIVRQSKPAQLNEPGDVILGTEEIISKLDASTQEQPAETSSLLTQAAVQLTNLWSKHGSTETCEGGIGPSSNEGLAKADYLSSLLLETHHPYSSKVAQALQGQRNNTSVKRSNACTFPRGLLNWLDTYHNPFPDDFDTIDRHQPSPADHERFWDAVFFSLSRGKFDRVIKLLKNAGWENAVTALDDYPQTQPQGYGGKQLNNIVEVIECCIDVLQTSPSLKGDNWDIKGADWTLFRRRIRQALTHLEAFAGEDAPSGSGANLFAISERDSFAATNRRAESKIPWSVYENMKLVYGLLLGGVDELLDTSQDWLEAVIFLTVWWDGENEPAMTSSLRQSTMRKSVGGSQKPREVDVAYHDAYRKRLADAFVLVTTEEDDVDPVFTVDSMDAVQVALSCVMEDNVENVIGILRTWSLPISTAIVEVATLGQWLPQARPKNRRLLDQGFDSEDLMVLSHGPGQIAPQPGELDRDQVLCQYADALAGKEVIASSDDSVTREGWQLAVSILGRLDDPPTIQKKIAELLDQIELTDEERVDNVLGTCSDQGLYEQAKTIAERYADDLADSSHAFGAALIYYARAHAIAKLKSTIALLISMCLLQSASIPSVATMDPQLSSLLTNERQALVRLAREDNEAATILSSHLSGYATVRRFYDLRDQDSNLQPIERGSLRPLERKREAAKALLAVVDSAADCIRGGLFDPAVESVVPVDAVLVLLGEALPLLNHAKRIFNKDQVFTLLRIVEDFATAPGRIRENAESLLQTSITAYGNSGALSSFLKNDATSNGSGLTGSSYDMLASSIVLMQSPGKSTEVIEPVRAWDWRKGLDGFGGGDVDEKEILSVLRMALAREVAQGWGGLINW